MVPNGFTNQKKSNIGQYSIFQLHVNKLSIRHTVSSSNLVGGAMLCYTFQVLCLQNL